MCELEISKEALLFNFEDDFEIPEESSYICKIWKDDWLSCIDNDVFKFILKNYKNKEAVQIFKTNNHEEVFCVGVTSLLCFIQCNFTGPALSNTIIQFLDAQKKLNTREELMIDSEEINVNVTYPELLLVAKYIFENVCLDNSNLVNWWYLRYIIIHQHLLDETAATLFSAVDDKVLQLTTWEINNRLKAKLYLEISQFYLLFNKINDCEIYLSKAKDLLGVKLELTGILGKRTKYQQNDLAQIILQIYLNDEITRPQIKNTVIPEIIKLNDDVRLDKIKYNNDYEPPILPVVEQAIVLTTVQHMQRAKPKDELLQEESEAFLSMILQQNNVWTVRFMSLLLRCFLESNHKRTIERSLSQIELLISNFNNEEPKALHRLSTIWCTGMQPKWKITAHMANLMLNLGLVKASLDIFLNLQQWEEVIVCYTIMQLRHKAAEIIQEQIAQNPTVKLWCLLGDATDDISCYEKAWDLSKQKSSRAQRHWGQYLFAKKEYATCIPHLQKSLEINSLQSMVWLRLGYAALEIEDWTLAASAYRRYTYLEPGGFEAWNNLAKAYIKLGEKTRAHYALQEALKYSFDNWKIWENFMVVSTATNNFNDVIRSYHQILDLKEKHYDPEVLFLLTTFILTNADDLADTRILTQTRELFGRLTSLHPNEWKLWDMYSDLSPTTEIKAQRLYRAYRGLAQSNWLKDPEKTEQVLNICKRLGEATLEAGKNTNTSTARLTLKSVITATKKELLEQHTEILNELEDILQKITNLLA